VVVAARGILKQDPFFGIRMKRTGDREIPGTCNTGAGNPDIFVLPVVVKWIMSIPAEESALGNRDYVLNPSSQPGRRMRSMGSPDTTLLENSGEMQTKDPDVDPC